MIPTQPSALNPAADEYIPVHHHHFPLLPPPPKALFRRLPPPPSFFSTNFFVLPPPPPMVFCRPVQFVWRPLTYSGKYTAPAIGASDVDKQTIFPGKKQKRLVWRPRSKTPEDYPFKTCTSLMIRNIPNRLRQKELVRMLSEHCAEMNKGNKVESEFDFVYLPVDFNKLGNKGYAFVNFTTVAGAAGLYRAWNNLNWEKSGYETKKTRIITIAKIQGKDRLKAHFERSNFECNTDEYLPVELTPPCNGGNVGDVVFTTIGSRRSPTKKLGL